MPFSYVAAASAVVGAYSAYKGSKAAGEAADAAGSSSYYYNTLADISADQYELWKTEGLPKLRELAGFAKSDIAEEQGLAADAVRTQHALARERTTRALGYARNPGDPGYAEILAGTYGAEASDVASAMTQARRAALERDYARTADIVNIYRGFPGQAMQGYAAAGRGQYGVGALQGNIANMYGNWASQAAYGAGNIMARNPQWFQPQSSGPEQLGGPPGDYTGGSTFDPTTYWQSADPGYSAGMKGGGKIIDVPYQEGGKIRGPGTGTSDSISAIKRPGTYILSADTVRAIGTKKLNDFMEKAGIRPGQGETSDRGGAPVRLSKGEYAMPPEVTSYFGEDFFNKLQQKYHRPVFSDEDGQANGGAIRRRVLPRRVEEAIFRAMPDNALMRR